MEFLPSIVVNSLNGPEEYALSLEIDLSSPENAISVLDSFIKILADSDIYKNKLLEIRNLLWDSFTSQQRKMDKMSSIIADMSYKIKLLGAGVGLLTFIMGSLLYLYRRKKNEVDESKKQLILLERRLAKMEMIIMCPICMEEKRNRTFQKCGHSFCQNCISNLNRNTCPTCRAPYNEKDIITIFL